MKFQISVLQTVNPPYDDYSLIRSFHASSGTPRVMCDLNFAFLGCLMDFLNSHIFSYPNLDANTNLFLL